MRFFDGHYSVESLCTFKREIDRVHLEIRPMLSKASPAVFSQQSISSSSRGCLKGLSSEESSTFKNLQDWRLKISVIIEVGCSELSQ